MRIITVYDFFKEVEQIPKDYNKECIDRIKEIISNNSHFGSIRPLTYENGEIFMVYSDNDNISKYAISSSKTDKVKAFIDIVEQYLDISNSDASKCFILSAVCVDNALFDGILDIINSGYEPQEFFMNEWHRNTNSVFDVYENSSHGLALLFIDIELNRAFALKKISLDVFDSKFVFNYYQIKNINSQNTILINYTFEK